MRDNVRNSCSLWHSTLRQTEGQLSIISIPRRRNCSNSVFVGGKKMSRLNKLLRSPQNVPLNGQLAVEYELEMNEALEAGGSKMATATTR